MNTAIIIDDEPLAAQDLAEELAHTGLLSVTKSYRSFADAYRDLKDGGKQVDFIFMDVEMPKLKGTDALAQLKPYAHFQILCTGHAHYALEGHQKLADGFLLKPALAKDIVPLITKLTQRLTIVPESPPTEYWIKHYPSPELAREEKKAWSSKPHRQLRRVALHDIVLFRRNNNDVDIYVIKDGTLHVAGSERTTIKEIRRKLAHSKMFICANAGELVNERFIVEIQSNMLKIVGDRWVYLTESGRSDVQAYLKEASFKSH